MSRRLLFILPRGPRGGFQASIRGHLLDLADPHSSHLHAPTPDDLFVASIASDLAWFARQFLRARALDDYVAVSAEWQARERTPTSAELAVTITVSSAAAEAEARLTEALVDRFPAQSQHAPMHFSVRA